MRSEGSLECGRICVFISHCSQHRADTQAKAVVLNLDCAGITCAPAPAWRCSSAIWGGPAHLLQNPPDDRSQLRADDCQAPIFCLNLSLELQTHPANCFHDTSTWMAHKQLRFARSKPNLRPSAALLEERGLHPCNVGCRLREVFCPPSSTFQPSAL